MKRISTMKLAVIALAFAMLPLGETASAQSEISYPSAIRDDLESARKECADADDGKITLEPGLVRKLDLTGNKRVDYIVDFDKLKCSTFESVFCGTGGCLHNIYVTTKAGELRRVFTGPVHLYQISKAPGAKTVTFHLHGGFCGKAGPEDCVKKRLITEKPFEFRDR
jgi:hypothetical protein